MAELNLIPYSTKQKKEKNARIKNIVYYIIILISIMFIGGYIPYITESNLAKQEFSLKAEVDSKAYIINERNQMRGQIDIYNKFISHIDTIDKQGLRVYDLIEGIQDVIPKDVTISSLSYSGGTISIIGVTNNYNLAAEFAANLQNTQLYKRTSLDSISRGIQNELENFSFSITIKI